MSDYLSRLAARSLNRAEVVRPRLTLLFEPPPILENQDYSYIGDDRGNDRLLRGPPSNSKSDSLEAGTLEGTHGTLERIHGVNGGLSIHEDVRHPESKERPWKSSGSSSSDGVGEGRPSHREASLPGASWKTGVGGIKAPLSPRGSKMAKSGGESELTEPHSLNESDGLTVLPKRSSADGGLKPSPVASQSIKSLQSPATSRYHSGVEPIADTFQRPSSDENRGDGLISRGSRSRTFSEGVQKYPVEKGPIPWADPLSDPVLKFASEPPFVGIRRVNHSMPGTVSGKGVSISDAEKTVSLEGSIGGVGRAGDLESKIQVTIGRVEVRADTPYLPQPQEKPAGLCLSLEEYLKQQDGG